ncbi:hypothetical protein HK103_003953 [Boothiomyces macroporosus]|uniref:ATP-grasp domain-containing protein n=1 Tax=Boothiomyces macroporosus TaxID=261099 RepID=A0AAD5UMJ2_9FUNG|nr:hypothetical protein HK103_003953 [Boothiomyces macroporosus]
MELQRVIENIYILEGHLAQSQANEHILLANESGRQETVAVLHSLLKSLYPGSNIETLPITLINYRDVLEKKIQSSTNVVVINLCDGVESDGYPGIGVVNFLEERNVAFTGADAIFYENTTSKPVLKKLLEQENVPTAKFIEIRRGAESIDLDLAISQLGFPFIVKPAISYGSLGITDESVVESKDAALKQVQLLQKVSEAFVEVFLPGREYTVLVTGDAHQGVKVYPAMERNFSDSLKGNQRILSFERSWEGFDLGSIPAADASHIYWHELAPSDIQEKLKEISKLAYLSCGGSGYGRVDIRTKSRDHCEPVVLEVNANCGLSFIPHSSSLADILFNSQTDPKEFCKDLINFAIRRQAILDNQRG